VAYPLTALGLELWASWEGTTMTQLGASPTAALPDEIHSALLQLLSNPLVLCHMTPYLSCYDVLNLAAASRACRYLIYHTPQVFRRLDLTPVKIVQAQGYDAPGIDHGGQTWRNVQVDENLTEDE
jgi:hypothetical protein